MSTDLRDKIAATLYFAHEVTGQGDATWDELIATYGDSYEAIVNYRSMADLVMPVVDAEIAAWDERLQGVVRSRNSFISRLDERNRDIEGNIRALNDAIAGRSHAEQGLRDIEVVLRDGTIHATNIRERALAVLAHAQPGDS